MSITTNFYLAYITTKNEEEALTLANSAVEKNLAACGNIFPKIKSVYKWDKKLQNDEETLLLPEISLIIFNFKLSDKFKFLILIALRIIFLSEK